MSGIGYPCACGRLRTSHRVEYEGWEEINFMCDACYVIHCYNEKKEHPDVGMIESYHEALELEEYTLRLHREGRLVAPLAPPPSRKRGRKEEVLYHVQMQPGISLRELARLMKYSSPVPLRKHTTRMIRDGLLELRLEKHNGKRSYRYYSLQE